jgi:ABC transport system ATP-binding/permease protein
LSAPEWLWYRYQRVSEAHSFKLIIEDDEGRRSVVPVDLGNVSIGRLENNTIRLNERNVSRQHARLLKDNGSVFAEDLGSYNGVYVNGDRIKGRHELREGDLIKIGDFHLELRGEGLARRPEETTQRTVLPEREDTLTDVRLVDLEPTAMIPTPTAPPPAPAAALRRDITKPIVPREEPTQDEATAIIRIDSPELQAAPKQAIAAGERARLVCVSPQFAGQEFEIAKTEVTIGRTDENDIAIDHRSVSRHHARILVVSGRYRLVDLKSANGTLVNGEQYAQAELKRGDLVELGHVKFRFVPPGETYNLSVDEAAQMKGRRAGGDAGALGNPLTKLASLPLLPMAIGAALVVAAALLMIFAMRQRDPTPVIPTEVPVLSGRATGASGEVDALVARAQGALSQRRWQQAANWALAALDMQPNNPTARDVAQQAQLELKAQASYESATSAISHSDWAAAWRALGELPEASVYRAQSAGLVDQVKGALVAELTTRARNAVDAEDYDKALSVIDDISRIDATRPEVGQLRSEVDRARSAPKMNRPRAKLQPPQRKELGKAIASPQAPPPAITAAPAKDAESLYNEGKAALTGGDLQGAINHFGECVQIDANYARCYRALGIAYAKSGNGAKAARYYKQYLKVAPDAPDASQVRQLLEQYETAP